MTNTQTRSLGGALKEVTQNPTSKVPEDAASILAFALHFDAPVPLAYWGSLVPRSVAFKVASEGKLKLEMVGRRAALRPSVLADYLKASSARGPVLDSTTEAA